MAERIPERIVWAVSQVPAKTAGPLLEIGCGGGQAIALLCARNARLHVTAIDRSALQVARARERNRACIDSGRARIERLALEDAPDALGPFATILAVNVNAFWTSPATSLAAMKRLLKPRGRAYVIYEPPSSAQLARLRTTMTRLFADHGFTMDDVRTASFGKSCGICFVVTSRGKSAHTRRSRRP